MKAVLLALLSVLAALAFGQPLTGRQVETIEATVLNGQYVFVARIVGIHPDGAMSGNGCNVDVRVEELLKGAVSAVVQARVDAPAATLEKWKARGSRLLIVNGNNRGNAIDLSSPDLAILTAELRVLQEPGAVVQAARDAIRAHPGVTAIETFPKRVPPEAVRGTKVPYVEGLFASVPADEALQRWAFRGLGSKSIDDRAQAAGALYYFRSNANVARLKGLLRDPGLVVVDTAENNGGREVRSYKVREAAHRVLRAWAIDVPEPALRKEIDRPERVTRLFLYGDLTAAKIDALARFPNLTSLSFGSALTEESAARIGRLTRITSLGMDAIGLTDDVLRGLSGLTRLESLNAGWAPLTDASVPVIAGFRNLKKARLKETRITDAGIAELRRLRPGLEIER